MIGIDIKNYALYSSGIYNATFPLVEHWIDQSPDREFLLLGPKAGGRYFGDRSNVRLKNISIPPLPKYGGYLYNFTSFPFAARSTKLELFYSPYFDLWIPEAIPSVITIHDMVHFHLPELYRPSLRKYLTFILKQNAKRAKHILTVSEFTRQDILKTLNVPESKVTVINNSIDENFLQPPKGDDYGKELANSDLFRGKKIVLYSGGSEHRKNLARLFKAFAKLPEEYLLVLTGREESYGGYPELLRPLKEKGQLHSTGFIEYDQLKQLYHLVDLIAYPSLWEGFGYPIIEAMAVKKPIVCSHASCLPSVGGDYPIYFDPLSEQEIKEAIIKGCNTTIAEDFQFPEKYRVHNSKKSFLETITKLY